MTESEYLTTNDPAAMLEYVNPTGEQMEIIRQAAAFAMPNGEAALSGATCNIIRDVFGNPWRNRFHAHKGCLYESVPAGNIPDAIEKVCTITPDVQALVAGMLEPKLRTCDICKQWVKNCPCPESGELYEYDFSAMPILADALEEAGCTNEEILNHLRGLERWEIEDSLGKKHLPKFMQGGWRPRNRPFIRQDWVLQMLAKAMKGGD